MRRAHKYLYLDLNVDTSSIILEFSVIRTSNSIYQALLKNI